MSARMLDRRAFLGAAALAGGGLGIGFLAPGCSREVYETKLPESAEPAFAPNAWLRILPNGEVDLVLDRVEMGQGTMTSHAMLLGEELDYDPQKIKVRFAPAHRAYDNPDKNLRFQVTGASTSVKTSWDPLRRAGATAREMLRQAAAEAWSVPVAECRANDGEIVHAGSGRRASYGALASRAARQRIPDEVRLKPRAEMRWVGKPMRRLDAAQKTRGAVKYGIDVTVPDMVNAVVVRPPMLNGRVASFDGSEAMKQRGVIAVVPIPTGVAVVAQRHYQALAAADKVRVTWRGGAPEMSDKTLSDLYHDRVRRPAKAVAKRGDVDDAFARAKKVIEATYELPFLAHSAFEPLNCVAHVRKDKTEIWAGTQSMALTREAARRITGHAPDDIVVHQTWLGGGFGRRSEQDWVEEAVQVSRLIGKPVKIIWSREDDTRHDFYRPMSVHYVRAAVDERGAPIAWFQRIATQSIVGRVARTWVNAITPEGMPEVMAVLLGRTAGGAFGGGLAPDETSTEGAASMLYGFPSLRVEHALVDVPVPVGFWRSVGFSANAFAVESFVDELAHAAGADPYAFRRKLLADEPRALAVLDLAASRAGWTANGKRAGRGIAYCRSFDTHVAQVAEVEQKNGEIRVTRVVCAVDCGSVVNPDGVAAQMESGIAYGLSAALKQKITLERGGVVEGNFNDYPLIRMFEMPKVEVHIVSSEEAPTGVGEPGVPPIAPAVANAIFTLTGKRLRKLPLGVGA